MNTPNAQPMHSRSLGEPEKKAASRKAGLSRTDLRYWNSRVEKVECRNGDESPNYSVQIAFRGRRMRFPLERPNKDAAAGRAQRIYLSLLTKGWEATIAEFKPQIAKPTKACTLGEFLKAVKTTSGLKPHTFTIYAQALRLIVAGVAEIPDNVEPILNVDGTPKVKKEKVMMKSRFDYKSGGRELWLTKVHAVRLDILTPERVQRWKLNYLAKAKSEPDAQRRAMTSVNSHLRNARSLFSEKAIKHVHNVLLLPSPLPFAGVKLEKRGNARYSSRIDAKELLADARKELAGTERFKIFCLGLLCGLRKREIDSLLWEQVDFAAGQIRIEPTKYFSPKSEDSIGVVDLDAELIALLRNWNEQATGEFVVESPNPPRYHISRVNYRCEKEFTTLYGWLEGKGISARKKLHELRKELGAILASEQGIFAAQQMLRHADIRTTQQFYVDKKRRITAGLGSLLSESGDSANTKAATFTEGSLPTLALA